MNFQLHKFVLIKRTKGVENMYRKYEKYRNYFNCKARVCKKPELALKQAWANEQKGQFLWWKKMQESGKYSMRAERAQFVKNEKQSRGISSRLLEV